MRKSWLAVVLMVVTTMLWSGDSTPVPHLTISTTTAQAASLRPVAKVYGQSITLGNLESALLMTEGPELLKDRLEEFSKNCDLTALRDDQPILTWNPTRGQLAYELLLKKGGVVREELIKIALIEQALAIDGLRLDRSTIEAELARMQKALDTGMERRGTARTDLRTVIQTKYNMSLERWTQQRGFLVLTGLHALVERRAMTSISDADVNAWIEQHRDLYRIPAAVELSVLYFSPTAAALSDPTLFKQEQDNQLSYANALKKNIAAGKLSFASVWANCGGALRDQDAKPGGNIGWVRRDGRRDGTNPNALTVALKAVEAAFACQPPWPVMLEPVATETHVQMVMVTNRREANDPSPSELAARVRMDILNSELNERTDLLMNELFKPQNPQVERFSLPSLMALRAKELGISAHSGAPKEP